MYKKETIMQMHHSYITQERLWSSKYEPELNGKR